MKSTDDAWFTAAWRGSCDLDVIDPLGRCNRMVEQNLQAVRPKDAFDWDDTRSLRRFGLPVRGWIWVGALLSCLGFWATVGALVYQFVLRP